MKSKRKRKIRKIPKYKEILIFILKRINNLLSIYIKTYSIKVPIKRSKVKKKYSKKAEGKIAKIMKEGYKGKLHSGSKKGPIVTNPKQMKAIAISEAKKKGYKVPSKRK